jgi:hypothetical protein
MAWRWIKYEKEQAQRSPNGSVTIKAAPFGIGVEAMLSGERLTWLKQLWRKIAKSARRR